MHERANLSRASVSGPTHVHGAIHSRDIALPRRDKESTGGSQEQAWRDRVQRLEDLHDQGLAQMRSTLAKVEVCELELEALRLGYYDLVKAHASLLLELSIIKDENVRYPLSVPEFVAVDLCDQLMEQMS